MGELIAIHSPEIDLTWLKWVSEALSQQEVAFDLMSTTELIDQGCHFMAHKKIILICDLNEIGRDFKFDELLMVLRRAENIDCMRGASVAMINRSQSDWYTKTYARSLLLQLNMLGATILGKPLVELLPDYENLMTWQKQIHLPLETVAKNRIADLATRLMNMNLKKFAKPKILVLHASKEEESNTLALWHLVMKTWKDSSFQYDYKEIYIERGSITDCIGCPFEVCVHEAKQLSCVVGGQYVEQIIPALEWADAIVWICPNYNDTISADLISVINRMSGFYRTRDLSTKRVYGIIVSGNSGTDAVAHQLVGSLNVNKGFSLPPKFCLGEIGNGPLSILQKAGVEDKSRDFAKSMMMELCE